MDNSAAAAAHVTTPQKTSILKIVFYCTCCYVVLLFMVHSFVYLYNQYKGHNDEEDEEDEESVFTRCNTLTNQVDNKTSAASATTEYISKNLIFDQLDKIISQGDYDDTKSIHDMNDGYKKSYVIPNKISNHVDYLRRTHVLNDFDDTDNSDDASSNKKMHPKYKQIWSNVWCSLEDWIIGQLYTDFFRKQQNDNRCTSTCNKRIRYYKIETIFYYDDSVEAAAATAESAINKNDPQMINDICNSLYTMSLMHKINVNNTKGHSYHVRYDNKYPSIFVFMFDNNRENREKNTSLLFTQAVFVSCSHSYYSASASTDHTSNVKHPYAFPFSILDDNIYSNIRTDDKVSFLQSPLWVVQLQVIN